MYTSILLIASIGYVTAIPAPQTSTPTGPFFLGRPCTPSSQCEGGAQCYAVNSNLNPTCGGFGATCTSNAQCATNTCQNGICNGAVAPTLPLGTMCYESQQCANGASCYAVNAMQVPACGNFQAGCTSNSQCAFNTCVNGFCSGLLPSSSSVASVVSSTSPAVSSSSIVASTSSSLSPVYTPSSSSSSSIPIFTLSTSTPTTSAVSIPAGVSSTGYATISTTITTTICPSMSMSTSVSTPLPAATSISQTSAANSTKPTATKTQPAKYTGGAGRASLGGAGIGSALAFALLLIV